MIARTSDYITKILNTYFKFLYKKEEGLALGRWCHIAAERYKETCNTDYKIDMANRDNCHGNNNKRI